MSPPQLAVQYWGEAWVGVEEEEVGLEQGVAPAEVGVWFWDWN